MAHAISAVSTRYDHMSPVAALLAGALHVATALALFWVSPLNRHDVDEGPAIDVTIEQPKPPVEEARPPASPPAPTPPVQPPAPAVEAAPPPPPPAASAKAEPKPQPKPQEQPRSKIPIGISPPAPVTPDPPAQKEAETATTREAVESSKPAERTEAAPEPPPPKPTEPPQQAAAAPPVETPLEKVLPPVEAPASPLSMRDFVRVLPPQPAPPPRPQPPEQPPPQQHHQEPPAQTLQHSPLSTPPSPPQSSASASVSTFVNPAAIAARNRTFDVYRLQVASRISQHRVFAANNSEEGTVELNISIARDGRLVDVRVSRSSGYARLDSAVLEAARAASPYNPPPPEIAGSPVSFTLPMGYRKMR